MKLTFWKRIKLCWEVLTIKGCSYSETHVMRLSTYRLGYQDGVSDAGVVIENLGGCVG